MLKINHLYGSCPKRVKIYHFPKWQKYVFEGAYPKALKYAILFVISPKGHIMHISNPKWTKYTISRVLNKNGLMWAIYDVPIEKKVKLH